MYVEVKVFFIFDPPFGVPSPCGKKKIDPFVYTPHPEKGACTAVASSTIKFDGKYHQINLYPPHQALQDPFFEYATR